MDCTSVVKSMISIATASGCKSSLNCLLWTLGKFFFMPEVLHLKAQASDSNYLLGLWGERLLWKQYSDSKVSFWQWLFRKKNLRKTYFPFTQIPYRPGEKINPCLKCCSLQERVLIIVILNTPLRRALALPSVMKQPKARLWSGCNLSLPSPPSSFHASP